MKTIGFIGGVTWHSTVEYYKKINEGIAANLGGHHSAKIVISSVDFDEVMAAQNSGNPKEVLLILKEHLKKIESAGADFFAIGANTLHMYTEELLASTKMPIVHIVDETAKQAISRGLKKLCLLGTGFTMRHKFFIDGMATHGLETIVPDDSMKDDIHRSIFEELVHGKIEERTKKMYLDVVESSKNAGCDGIILGCTEIPLILSSDDTQIPLLDTTEIHASAIVKAAIP